MTKEQKENVRVPQTHPEVLRIHVQLVTVQLAQLSKGALEVMCVLKGISKGGQHLPAMGFDPGVAHDSRVRRQGAKIVKEPLGPWWTPRSLWGDHNHRAGSAYYLLPFPDTKFLSHNSLPAGLTISRLISVEKLLVPSWHLPNHLDSFPAVSLLLMRPHTISKGPRFSPCPPHQ
uniref:Uncharacterized protein n=1 Tax=Sus scrofa TaxID=9823 RepID=A0A4X1SXV2_PIG